ncbi:phytoene desaturase family protein [Kitasatospora paracochleata]|uniref:Phytoene dehydrogenase-like protein n=1 Tax=Kitasatospora paracochleata TaxID=58354 RepID=A0ABT1J090_9ACTN|nr:NAD(P)/FAD-dependent oxidoreductase [Kitasatospora paracochleata]MCP2310812.1 phytoene dehydrogenase-like protein [Kitasatospora paracochleata]
MARIVIIGAGMGGLAAASRLATLGHRVTVCEASGTYGGMVGRYEREGFAFDTGPGLLALPAVYRDLALKTGREPLEQLVELAPVDPESRHLFPDGSDVVLANASRGGVGRALDAAFGAGAGERWGAVVNRGRTVWEATRRPLLEEPRPAEPVADPYPVPARRGLARWLPSGRHTLADVARRELGGHPGLTALLTEYALRHSLDPAAAPAAATVLPYMEQSFGVWYVRGGLRALADAVYRRCELRGVEFRFGAAAVPVVEDGRVCGVEVGGERIAADLVLSSADPGAAPEAGPTGTPAGGRITVLLALRGARPEGTVHRTVVHAADGERELDALRRGALPERPTVQLLRPDDAALVPDADHESATLTVTVPGAVDPAGFAEHLLEHLAANGVDLRERLLWHETRHTPYVPAPSLAGGPLAPANESPTPGLYLIGGHAHPGGGLARVGMSACITAGLIGPA